MANLTISVDNEVLKKARIRALEQNTSVNAVLREFLESFAGVVAEHDKAVQNVISLSESSLSRRGKRQWSRDELYERI